MALGKNGYVKQIIIYLSQNDAQKAYDTAKEFVGAFNGEMIAHFLFAKSAYVMKSYEEAALEARKALNLSEEATDIMSCAVLAGTAYYESGQYAKGLELLDEIAKVKTSEELETLRFVFAMGLEKSDDAAKYLDALYSLNKESAEKLLMKFL